MNRDHFKEFRGLKLSSLGVGTYLGGLDAETDKLVEEAVFHSVSSGAVNVIDTAINYRLQRAERSVGRALTRLASEGIERGREALLVCTKNGYVSSDGELSADFWAHVQDEFFKPGELRQEEIAGEAHSMALPFLKEQLKRSMANLGLTTFEAARRLGVWVFASASLSTTASQPHPVPKLEGGRGPVPHPVRPVCPPSRRGTPDRAEEP